MGNIGQSFADSILVPCVCWFFTHCCYLCRMELATGSQGELSEVFPITNLPSHCGGLQDARVGTGAV